MSESGECRFCGIAQYVGSTKWIIENTQKNVFNRYTFCTVEMSNNKLTSPQKQLGTLCYNNKHAWIFQFQCACGKKACYILKL